MAMFPRSNSPPTWLQLLGAVCMVPWVASATSSASREALNDQHHTTMHRTHENNAILRRHASAEPIADTPQGDDDPQIAQFHDFTPVNASMTCVGDEHTYPFNAQV